MTFLNIFAFLKVSYCIFVSCVYFHLDCSFILRIRKIFIIVKIFMILIKLIVFQIILLSIILIIRVLWSNIIEICIAIIRDNWWTWSIWSYFSIHISNLLLFFLHLIVFLSCHISITKCLKFYVTIILLKFIIFLLIYNIWCRTFCISLA